MQVKKAQNTSAVGWPVNRKHFAVGMAMILAPLVLTAVMGWGLARFGVEPVARAALVGGAPLGLLLVIMKTAGNERAKPLATLAVAALCVLAGVGVYALIR
jgi:uncharacterized YccA/Bax inhibitor family protein